MTVTLELRARDSAGRHPSRGWDRHVTTVTRCVRASLLRALGEVAEGARGSGEPEDPGNDLSERVPRTDALFVDEVERLPPVIPAAHVIDGELGGPGTLRVSADSLLLERCRRPAHSSA